MIEKNLRKIYQKYCIDPFLGFKGIHKLNPIVLTFFACLFGLAILPLLAFRLFFLAFLCLMISGFLDTFDGSLARKYQKTSAKGTALDIFSDRLVEFAVILGLYFVDPISRALPALCMLGSILICITSFLVVGIFTENNSEKSFHYSPGLIERAEAFIFFTAMILLPSTFFFLSYLFAALVFLTAWIRMAQFSMQFSKTNPRA